jgi:hypothetical protein
MLAPCSYCAQDMALRVSCRPGGRPGGGLRYGDEPQFAGLDIKPNCHDCGTPIGGFHHLGCTNEWCRRCGNQLPWGCVCLEAKERTSSDA